MTDERSEDMRSAADAAARAQARLDGYQPPGLAGEIAGLRDDVMRLRNGLAAAAAAADMEPDAPPARPALTLIRGEAV